MKPKNNLYPRFFIFLSLILALAMSTITTSSQAAIVKAVLFYSPTCPHCHKVMTEDLPPLMEQYGERLEIMAINVSQPEGQKLYQDAVLQYQIPQERLGVPTLIVGDLVLVGDIEIPTRLPEIIEAGLAAGGIAWPAIPGLDAIVQANTSADTPQPDPLSIAERFTQDTAGNSLAVIVLIAMIASLIAGFSRLRNHQTSASQKNFTWLIPVLAVVGAGIALYLSFIEISHAQAICGPVGDCNTVQQSPYATLWGVLPIGVLGLLGYLAIMAGWVWGRSRNTSLSYQAVRATWFMALTGLVFSIYLTFLEPFVIGASCAWCLASAVIMTIIFWLATDWWRSLQAQRSLST